MRLIDADKLIEDIINNLWDWKTVDGITSTTVLKQTISDIKNQPSIDAIPIDWLLKRLLDDEHLEMHHAVCCLWEIWMEENETNKCR